MNEDTIDPFDRALGAMVRARRRELRMSQSKLGDLLGVTFQQVQKYERGVNRISAAALKTIAPALDRPIAWFYGEVEKAAGGDAARAAHVRDLVFSPHGERLAAAFLRIANAGDRAAIVDLVERFANNDAATRAAAGHKAA